MFNHSFKQKNLAQLISIISACLIVTACTNSTSNVATTQSAHSNSSSKQLAAVLDSLSDKQKERYQYRHPQQTLEFFGIEPGMKVGEVLPGNNGWYTKVLVPYLGSEGELVGIDYPLSLWPNFSFMTEERLAEKKTWVADWTAATKERSGENSARINAYQLQSMPESMAGTLDAVLFFRALHNLARFNEIGSFLDNGLAETYRSLKPGGIVGVVQHQAREDRPDAWADGNNGYLKSSFVIAKMQAAGFEFVSESDINANPKDQAGEGDNVWRLAPSGRRNFKQGSPESAALEAIGESNRMTLKFRKPI